MTILKVVRQQKLWISVFFVVISGTVLLAFLLSSGKPDILILPVEESAGSLCACRLQYTATHGEQSQLYLEHWQEGELVEQTLLTTLDDGGIYSVQVIAALEGKLLWQIFWNGGAMEMETVQPSGFVYSALTQGVMEDEGAETGIIILCLGFGDLEAGLPAIDPIALMHSVGSFSDYQEVQLVRIL